MIVVEKPKAKLYDFNEGLRARLSQMAVEQMTMQEAVMNLPKHLVAQHLKKMEQHADEMSRLASRLYGDDPSPLPSPIGMGEGENPDEAA